MSKFILTLGLACCLSLTGCLSSKYVEQKQYLLAAKAPTRTQQFHQKSSLYLNHVIAVAPFDQLNFLYRIDKYQYLTDYYNAFLVPPAEQLETMLISHLKTASKFTIQKNALPTANILSVRLTEFYADYRDKQRPQAIISALFTLSGPNDSGVICEKMFTQAVTLPAKNTASLLSAWNMGLQNILTNATTALNQCLK